MAPNPQPKAAPDARKRIIALSYYGRTNHPCRNRPRIRFEENPSSENGRVLLGLCEQLFRSVSWWMSGYAVPDQSVGPFSQLSVNLRSARSWGRVRRTTQKYSCCFRFACNRSRLEAKRGDHFLQADFRGLMPPWKPDSFRLADQPPNDERIPGL